jgi:hypothetical protein
MATATTGVLTVSFEELIRRLADEFGDLIMLTATANGAADGTTLIDTQRINTGTEELTGREIYVTSGTNDGLSRTISATTDTTGTLTVAAMTGQVLSGVTAEVYNKRGRGFLRTEYKRWINRAIDRAAGLAKLEALGTVSGLFSVDDPETTVPAALTEVFKVEWQDSNGFWNEIRKASRWGNDGWTAIRGSGKVRIMGAPARQANGRTLQVWGYARQDTLSADSDTCALDTDWVIAWAAYHMGRANLDRKPELASTLMLMERDERMDEARLRRLRHPDTMSVRS